MNTAWSDGLPSLLATYEDSPKHSVARREALYQLYRMAYAADLHVMQVEAGLTWGPAEKPDPIGTQTAQGGQR